MNTQMMRIIFLMTSVLYFWGCSGKREIAINPREVFQEKEYAEAVQQGDFFFSQMHLWGWKKAEEFYGRAYQIKQTPGLRDKRFLCLCLTAIREKDEQIINPVVYEEIDKLGDFPKNLKQQYLFDLIQHYRGIPAQGKDAQNLRAKERRDIDISLFDIQNSPFDTYLYLYLLNCYTYNFSTYTKELIDLFKNNNLFGLIKKYTAELSPLFIYNNFKELNHRADVIEKKLPQFAEFFVLRGDQFYKNNKLKSAAKYYQIALELIPEYTKASNGMGNIYYFTVGDYKTAIEYYNKTLKSDPLNSVALFGKGVSLHFLNEIEASDRVFDFMLEKQSLHHGEAFYYKAYNRFLSSDPLKARELVEKAKKHLPHSGEVFFLSALLHYNQGNMEEAEKDFLKTLYDPGYSKCYPLFYLGMIRLKAQNWTFFDYFSDSIYHFEARMRTMEKRIHEIESMALANREKEWMKKNQVVKLEDFRQSSIKLIQQMKENMEKNIKRKKIYDQQMKKNALSRVKLKLKENPLLLNRINTDGSTLLHKAVENGQMAVIKYLAEEGARLDIKNSEGYSPLHWAVLLGQTETVKLLIGLGGDINITTSAGYTPLHDAAHGGYKEIARRLVDAGADPYAREEQGKTPLTLAMEQGKKELFALLKPIHSAVKNNNRQKVTDFLKRRPKLLNALDEDGKTPLILAAANGYKDLAWFLINRGADVNSKDFDGYSPLHWAQEKGHQEIVQMLLAKGANVTDKEIFKKKLQTQDALIWNLGSWGWAIKTQNHFVIINYSIPCNFPGRRKPTEPLLTNGGINPNELKDQNVYVIYSNEYINHQNPHFIFQWEKLIRNITYIFGWEAIKGPRYICMKSREKKIIDDIEILTVKAIPTGVDFLIKVDGLKIFYSTFHDNGNKDLLNAYFEEITFFCKSEKNIDIVFLPFSSHSNQIHENLYGEFFNFTEKLMPTDLFLIPLDRDDVSNNDFFCGLEKFRLEEKKTLTTNIHYLKNRGDRFFKH